MAFNYNEWRKNLEYFESHKEEFRQRYGYDVYVAIRRGELVDRSLDKTELTRKYRAEKEVFIGNVRDIRRNLSPF